MNFLDLIKTNQRKEQQTEPTSRVLAKAIRESNKRKLPKVKLNSKPNSSKLTDDEYFATLNPKTNLRFDIPMLAGNDTQYFVKYVEYMKLRQDNLEEFNRIMEWN